MHDPFDGIASLWWDTREDLVAAMTSTEGRKAAAMLLEDEKRFIDFKRSSVWAAKEIVFIDEATS